MAIIKQVGKRDFVQHTSHYLKLVEHEDVNLVITHQRVPSLQISRVKSKTAEDLRGLIPDLTVVGDINDPILPGYDAW